MSSTTKNVLTFIGLIVAGIVVFKVAMYVLHLVLPILLIGAIAAGIYVYYNRKALGGGRRTLP